VIVLDEMSHLNGGGKQHAAVLQATASAERVHMFTATLYENHPVEVWTVYKLLHLPHLPSETHFAQDFVDWQVFDNGSRPVGWRSALAAANFRDLTAAHYFRRGQALADLSRPEYVRFRRGQALADLSRPEYVRHDVCPCLRLSRAPCAQPIGLTTCHGSRARRR